MECLVMLLIMMMVHQLMNVMRRLIDDMNDDDLPEMLNNIGECRWSDNWQARGKSSYSLEKDLEILHKLSDKSQQDLYRGCQSSTKF